MKVLVTFLSLVIGSVAVGKVLADEGSELSDAESFGVSPAPSTLAENQQNAGEPAKPLESVLDTIRQRLPGRALGARLVEWQGREAYEIRWIGEDGTVHDITADAVSGDILDER